MKLALILYALLGLSVCAKLPDTNSGDRVNLTEYQEELLNRTNKIVADKLANLTSFLKYYKRVVVEKSSENERMILLTIRQIERLRPTKDKEAECLLVKKQFQNQLRLFATVSAQDGFQHSLATISRKIETSIENFKKQNTLTTSDSDKIPRNPADGRDFLHKKLYDLKAQMMRELTNITLEYFYQRKAEIDLSDHVMNETIKQMNTFCGTAQPTMQPEDPITDEIPERLQRLFVKGSDLLLVQNNKTGDPMREEHEGWIDFKLRRLSEKLVNFVFEPPCSPPNVTNTSWENNQTQVTLTNQIISQWHDGCLLASSKVKDHYHLMAYLEQFRAPMGSRDGFNNVIAELDYKNSVPVGLEQNRHKLDFMECVDLTAPFIISELAPVVRMAFLGSCDDAQN